MSGPGGQPSWTSGHTVIAVAVPALEAVVRERTARQDASWLPVGPDADGFGCAHVTLLAPWLDSPTPADLDAVADVLAGTTPFDLVLDRVAAFPDGTLHLVAEPAGVLGDLTARLAERFPHTPPYGGRWPDLVPHLTLDHLATGATCAGLRRELAPLLPAAAHVTEVQLQWWANHGCHVRHRWPLGLAS